ncbi:D-Ala-D-Ala carboxypeptidase [Halomonas cupida]|uniref:serine-type D-Ala-D-Ala carboxypeptidase n=1 Tax=Halomonas cupida TaxID=44933 RepID=A0A1M7HSU7_9GAMM|nr:D-alanyl-D-alanine carboxypeptidase family protein [Halomonas cupida]GEN23875.1 D-Ala-D-Ala carboxypeptidase [Halomonas cupida]SHM31413.1 D-alanyl-D-alanine carboxypeptidase (penicillin-binding protein 5/6) [Halomonas cupida]
MISRLSYRRIIASTLVCLSLVAPWVSAQQTPAVPQPDVPEPLVMIPASPQIAATSWILIDANSGRVLAERNPDERVPPASLTKLMTAYLVERELERGNIQPDDMVPISENAWRTGGSKMFVEVGTRVSVTDLLHGIVIVSGNDASVAMAEYLAGGEAPFADLMNQHAAQLGMENTHYVNATGLPADNHYSSARDLMRLARHIILDYPEHYAIYSQKSFSYNGIDQNNRNRLLWRDDSVDGLKTGWTDAAGYCLVSSAQREDMRLISVVLGTSSEEARAQETQKLLSYGFRYYETLKLYDQGAVLNTPRVWEGTSSELKVGVDRDVYMTVPRSRNDELTARLDINESLVAPIAAGQQVGTMEVRLGDEVVGERPLVALEAVEQGGFFKRMFDKVHRFFSELIGGWFD